MDKMSNVIWSIAFAYMLFLIPLGAQAQRVDLQHADLQLDFVDVGEGDATIVRYRTGDSNHMIVIDAGNFSAGARIYKRLGPDKASSINSLIVTHPHPDHMGGVFALLELLPFANVFDNSQSFTSEESLEVVNRWYIESMRSRPDYKPLVRGDVLIFEPNGAVVRKGMIKNSTQSPAPALMLKVLWPPTPLPFHDWNSNSLVLELTYGSFSALLMGDANLATERALLSLSGNGFVIGKTDVLKAGHHGAADTGSPDFLAKIRPKYVVVSVNDTNVNQYPSNKLLDTLRDSGTQVFRTDRDGSLRMMVARNGEIAISHPR